MAFTLFLLGSELCKAQSQQPKSPKAHQFHSWFGLLVSVPWLYHYADWLSMQSNSAIWTSKVVVFSYILWKIASPVPFGSMRPIQYPFKVFIISKEECIAAVVAFNQKRQLSNPPSFPFCKMHEQKSEMQMLLQPKIPSNN